MSSNNSIMIVYLYIIGLYFSCVIQSSMCDICLTCSCAVQANKGPIINCHGKHLGNNDVLNSDLLTLNEYQAVNKLILSKNDIVNLPRYLLKKLRLLKSLDLSENTMERVYTTMFIDLSNLEDLNLSKNVLKSFDDSLLEVLPALLSLNLSYNSIDTIEHSMNKSATKITTLDLSHNNITNVPKRFLELLPAVEYLDLSFNRIHSLRDCELNQMRSLKVIYINNNFLTTLNMQMLPQSVLHLHAGHNEIAEVLYDLPHIEILNIEYNKITEMRANLIADSLRHLNISGNMLSNFPNATLENLRILDVSDNNITRVPESISVKNVPLLNELYVSNNPIRNLSFHSDVKLSSLVANNMSRLEIIDKVTFANLREPSKDCINLTISNNKQLSFIHPDALQHLNICSLDVSNNQLTYIARQLIVQNGNTTISRVNLQGNPFKCNCSLQWMLNDLVPKLYFEHPSLLDNLRCAWPPQISNMRMVHWYGWEGHIFCNNVSSFSGNIVMLNAAVEPNNQMITIESSFGVLAIIGATLSALVVLVIVGIIWNQRVHLKRRRINRKF